MSEIPIIIPAYEPDERMIALLNDLVGKRICPIIIVNDGSGEQYDELFKKAARMVEPCGGKVIEHEENKGKGRALKTAFEYVLSNYENAIGCVTADSDGQHTVGCIEKVTNALREEKNALVLGVRNFDREDVPWKSKVGNKLTMKVMKYVSGIDISDTQTGLRGIPREFMKQLINVQGERFEFETRMLLEAYQKYPIKEVVIKTIYESKENHQTHFDPIRDSIRIYWILGNQFWKYIFSSCSASLLDLSIFGVLCYCFRNRYIYYVAMATGGARLVSSIYNYYFNYKIVFRSKERKIKSATKYFILVIIQMGMSALFVTLGCRWLYVVPEVIVKIVVDSFLFLGSYYIQRSYIYN